MGPISSTQWPHSKETPDTGMLLSVAWNTDGTQLAGAGGNGTVIFGQLLDRWIQFFKCGSLIPSLWNLLLQSELVKYNPDLLLMTGGSTGLDSLQHWQSTITFVFRYPGFFVSDTSTYAQL